jgi:hypothetical protein
MKAQNIEPYYSRQCAEFIHNTGRWNRLLSYLRAGLSFIQISIIAVKWPSVGQRNIAPCRFCTLIGYVKPLGGSRAMEYFSTSVDIFKTCVSTSVQTQHKLRLFAEWMCWRSP